MNKITAFEYLLYRIYLWKNEMDSTALEEISFSRIKALKLLFFVAAVRNEQNEDLLDIFNNFYAMQFGPVESDVYNSMSNGGLSFFSASDLKLDVQGLSRIQEMETTPFIVIDNAIETLKAISPQIVLYSATDLVDVSHKWDCWRTAFEIASLLNKGSYRMSSTSIRKSNSVFVR